MENSYQTNRLLLNKLDLTDTDFIFELVNTPGWIKFIGDRNIRNREDAGNYIRKIINSPGINYWVVKIKSKQIPIGIVTFIKRDYFEHFDIGFAFLPEYTKQGYAYEATVCVLEDAIKDPLHTCILATTLKENIHSMQLLVKLGFKSTGEIQIENERLLVYSIQAFQ